MNVGSYDPTGNPGEYTFTGAVYENVSDASGSAAFDIVPGFVVYIPAQDPNTAQPVTGEAHRYVLTSVTVLTATTINGTVLYSEYDFPGTDLPLNGSLAIISQPGANKDLGFPVSSEVYNLLLPGMTQASADADLQNIIDPNLGGGSAPPVSFPIVANASFATILSVPSASYTALFFEYSIVRNSIVEVSSLTIANDGSATPGFANVGASTGSTGVVLSATVSVGNLLIQYTSDNTAPGTMKYIFKGWA